MSFLELDESNSMVSRLDMAQYTLFQMDVSTLKDNLRSGNVRSTVATLQSISTRVFGEADPDVQLFNINPSFLHNPAAKTARAALEEAPQLKPLMFVPEPMARVA